MRNQLRFVIAAALACGLAQAQAQAPAAPRVVDIPTRPGVTQRMIVLAPAAPKAAVVLLAGGHGGLQIAPDGSIKWGTGNFLVRSRQLFAGEGLTVAVVDAPSDQQAPRFLEYYRTTSGHVADLKAVIAWLRATTSLPVWLIGTSRGTQSAAYAATQLGGADAPDGIVLTSSILSDRNSLPVTAMALQNIRIPVLVVHHRQDGCALCAFSGVASLMGKLDNAPRKQLLAFEGGGNVGDPCQAYAYHGYNGLEADVVRQIAAWITTR
jgi:pimeloyl-ACP methyl ester carboxylesterase